MATPQKLVSPVQAARILKCDRVTVYRRVWAGTLPGVLVMGKLKISRDAIRAALKGVAYAPRGKEDK